ncbi:MAG: GDP-mannose 4,6-dehydratase [Elusimicrobia bacterium]|nr:GDP-mannose 4,6-dehydratase [Elusimicrobiota bacterium]
MRALITGGAGFIGSHLAELLLSEGWQVSVIDDLSTGSKDNLKAVEHHPNLSVCWGSVLDSGLLSPLVENCDVVFHLAASVGVRRIIDHPIDSIETNVAGTLQVLKIAAQGLKKVLIASTSEVYGKSERITLSENDDTIMGPTIKSRWSYACSKAIDEFLALAYFKEKGLPVIIMRFFNTVGPRQTGRYGMVIPRFVTQALREEPISVYGDGRQTRSFTDVRDTIRAMRALAAKEQAAGQVFNIGGGVEISIQELAEKIKTVTTSSSPIQNIPYEQAFEQGFEDIKRRVPDISKSRKFIGFEPQISFEETLRRIIDYHKSKAQVDNP